MHPWRDAPSNSSALRRSGSGLRLRLCLVDIGTTRTCRNIKFGVLQNREPELPADRQHVGFLVEDKLAHVLPMPT